MKLSLFRQFSKSIPCRIFSLGTALLVASLLVGLIPPPLVTNVATSIVPTRLEAELAEAVTALLPKPATALAQSCSDFALVIANFNNRTIVRFDGSNGSFDQTLTTGIPFSPNFAFQYPTPNGPLLLSSADGSIYKYDAFTGAADGTQPFISSGPPNALSFTEQMAVGLDGNLYVASLNNGTVKRFNVTTGALIDTFITLSNAHGLVQDSTGDWYVSDDFGGTIRKYDSSGTLLGTVATSTSTIRGLAIGPDGNLYANYIGGSTTVEEFTLPASTPAAGSTFATLDSGSSPFGGIAWGPDGNLYIADYGEDEVHVYDSSGSLIRTLTTNLSGPHGVAFTNCEETTDPPSLTITKSDDGIGPVSTGDTISYTIVVANTSGSTATNVVVTDTLPSGLTYVSSSSQVTYPSDGSSSVTLSNPSPTPPQTFDGTNTSPLEFTFDSTGQVSSGATLSSVGFTVSGEAINGSFRDEIDLQITTPGGGSVSWDFGNDLSQPGSAGSYSNVTATSSSVSGSAEGTFTVAFTEDFDDGGVDDNRVDSLTLDVTYSVSGNTAQAAGTPPDLIVSDDGIDLAVGETMTVTFQVTVDDPVSVSEFVNIAGVTASNYTTPTVASDITAADEGIITIGNRVWYDANDNGVIDGFEGSYGINGVTVELWDGTGTLTATTTTTNGGFYLFTTNLNNKLLQDGDYQVRIPATNNMGAAGSALPLDDWRSSTDTGDAADPNTDVDGDDNGTGVTSGADLTSGTVSLAAGTEPTQTVDTDDANGNLTVDFGFYDVCDTGAGDLGGNVFRDFNSDGVFDSTEPGWINGVTVTAYDNDGNATTTTINPDGSYDFDAIFPNPVTDADHIRLEFSGLPSWATSGVAGSNSGTTVQHHKAASCAADLAVQNPVDYCQSNPQIFNTCYTAGDPTVAGQPASTLPTLVSFEYDSTGRNDAFKSTLATGGDLGTVWGLAYLPETRKVYASAVLRRHAGLGDSGLGGIYEVDVSDLANPVTTPWVTVATPGTIAARGLSDSTPVSIDGDAYGLVGKMSLGDIDISEDGNTLYVMNLNNNGSLIAYDIDTQTALNTYAVTDPGCSDPTDVRPWGVKVHDGQVYIGVVCSEEAAGGSDANLNAHVMQLDAGAGTFSSIVTVPLNYTRDSIDSSCNTIRQWYRWDSDPANFNSLVCNSTVDGEVIAYPQPLLSDIEFDDDGSMILGFTDRMSLMGGAINLGPDPATGATLYSVIAGGDMVRVCSTAANTYVVEGNSGCPYMGGQSGITEYYIGDSFQQATVNVHDEIALGSLALLHGTGEVVTTVFDPLNDPLDPTGSDGSYFARQGVRWLSNGDGNMLDAYEIVGPTDFAPYGKASGLGDLELYCNAAPLEIGNYVWLDDDGDGIQDPCEDPIPDITVTLYDITGTQIASAVTDNNGEYYFISGDDPRLATGGVYATVPISVGVVPTTTTVGGLVPNTQYEIRIDTTQTALEGYSLTVANTTIVSTTLPDAIDSDGIPSGNDAIISLTTGDAGQNDHTFDFGFVPTQSLALEKTLASPANGVVMVGDTITFQLQITNTGVITITELNLSDTYDPAILQYITASITPDSQSAGSITWTGNFGAGTGGLLPNLPLAPGASFTITVNMEVIAPTRP